MRAGKVVAVAMLLAVVGFACSKEDAVTARSLKLTVQDGKATTLTMSDAAPTGFGPGDALIERAPVTDTAGKTIGQSVTNVTIIEGKSMEDATGQIVCTIELAGGNLLFVGSLATKDLGAGVEVPVVGGTGDYSGAGGVLKMSAPDMKHTELSFDLLIPKAPES